MHNDLANYEAAETARERWAASRARIVERHDELPVARFVDAGEVGGCGSTADDVREKAWALTALWWMFCIAVVAGGVLLAFKSGR
jgi:hypothetical protein